MCFQFTISLNKIRKTSQPKTTFCLSKMSGASKKSICLEFLAPITINTPQGSCRAPGGRLILLTYSYITI